MTRGKRKSRDILGRFSALSMAAVVLLSAFSTVMSSAISASAADSNATQNETFYIHKGKDLNAGDFGGTVRVKYTDSSGNVIDSDTINTGTSTSVTDGTFADENAWYTHSDANDIEAWADPNGVAKVSISSSVNASAVTGLVIENISDQNALAVENEIDSLYSELTESKVLVLYNNNRSNWSTPHYYVWRSTTSNATFPGQQMTRVTGSTNLWYAIVDRNTYDNVIFSNGSNTNQTADLTLPAAGAKVNNAYSSTTNSWYTYTSADYSVKVNLSARQQNHCDQTKVCNDLYLTSQNRAQWSKFSSSDNITSHGTSTIYFRPSAKWSDAYVHFDDNDPYHRHFQMTPYGENTGIFSATVPDGVRLAFSNGQEYDDSTYTVRNVPWSNNINTYNTYIERDRQWNTLSYALSLVQSEADYSVDIVNTNGSSNISWVNATYFDYYSNNELSQGWRKGLINVGNSSHNGQANDLTPDYREQFSRFNDYIINYAEANTAWRYPLIFGDLLTTGYMPQDVDTPSSYWTNYLSNNGNNANGNVFKRINNSNFLISDKQVYYNASVQGIVDDTLTNNNLTANDVAMPYFDYDLLHNEADGDETVLNASDYIFVDVSACSWWNNSSAVTTLHIWNNSGYVKYLNMQKLDDNTWYIAKSEALDGNNTFDSATNFSIIRNNTYVTSDSGWNVISKQSFQKSGSSNLNQIKINSNGNGIESQSMRTGTFTPGSSSSGSYATVISSSFPFTTTTDSYGVTYYSYNSGNAKDNAWFSYDSDGKPTTINYGAGTQYGVKNGYNVNTYGFYPFNTPNNNGGKTESGFDYGFGVRMDIEFTLPENGVYANGQPAEFKFTGDDDLWVFIDGELVLDLGGNHSQTEGSINFGEAPGEISATANQVDYIVNQGANQQSDTWLGATRQEKTISFNNQDPAQKHTMTIFYMEHGANDSNISMEFSVQPVINNLQVQKEVVTEDELNAGVESAVNTAINDEKFNFTLQKASTGGSIYSAYANQDYTLTDSAEQSSSAKTSPSGGFSLQDMDMANFSDELDFGDNIRISESNENLTFNYDTDIRVRDNYTSDFLNDSQLIKTDNNRTGTFNFANAGNDSSDPTSMIVYYTNTVQVGGFTLQKVLKNETGGELTDYSYPFTFNIQVDLDGAGTEFTYQPYDLEYSLTESGTQTQATYIATDGQITLTPGQVAHFNGLPEGATVSIRETVPAGYVLHSAAIGSDPVSNPSNGVEAEIGNTVSAVTFTNWIQPASANLAVNKTLDGENYTGSEFTFKADLIDIRNTTLSDGDKEELINSSDYTKTTNTYNTEEQRYVFDPLSLMVDAEHAGDYIFELTETTTNDNINTVGPYYAKITVTSGNASEPTYYTDLACNTPVNASTPTTPPTFANTTKVTDIEFTKYGDSNNTLSGVEFTLYTDEDCTTLGEKMSSYSDTSANAVSPASSAFTNPVTSGSDGKVVFEDLKYNAGTGNNTVYYIEETKTVNGYQLLAGTIRATIDNSGKVTLEFKGVGSGDSWSPVQNASITNNALPDLPLAGGSGVVPIVVTGVGLVLLSGAGYVIYRRRQRSSTY